MSLEGQQAPDFELRSTTGESVSLSDTLGSGPTVVVVNRGHWCSFCAEQLATFDRVAEDLTFNDVHESGALVSQPERGAFW